MDQETEGQTNTHREGTSPGVLNPVAATAADNFDKIPVSRKTLQTFITKTRRIKQCKELLMIIFNHPEHNIFRTYRTNRSTACAGRR